MISTVQEAMTTDIISITPDQTIEAAARIMTKFDISSLIVTKNSEFIGIITERDILIRVVAAGQNPKQVKVSDIMTERIITCKPDTPIEEACRTMEHNRIKKLPVVDKTGLRGILSLTDIAKTQPSIMDKIRNITIKAAEEAKTNNIIYLIQQDEGQHIEFKSSLRYDRYTREVNQRLETAVLKTICAFLNSQGGSLIIGLSDNKEIEGIQKDYITLKNMNRDGFQNHLIGLISNKIGNFYLNFIHIKFHEILGKDLCQVKIDASSKPTYLSNKGKQEFYVRTGNNSRPFNIKDSADYQKERWG